MLTRTNDEGVPDYGHFTTVRVEPDGVRGWSLHEKRLVDDSRAMFDTEVDLAAVCVALTTALEVTARPVTARIAVTAEDFDLTRPGGTRFRVDVNCRASPAAASDALGPVALLPLLHRRALSEVKHLSNAPEFVQRRRAQGAGFDDAVFVDADGLLSEGPTSALAFMSGAALVLPEAPALPSVTLRLLAEAAPSVGVDVVREEVRLGGLDRFDACFDVSAAMGLRRVSSIGDIEFRVDHRPVQELSDAYRALPRQAV